MSKIKVSIAQDKIYIPHLGACTPIFNYELPEKVVADLLAQGVQVTTPDGTPMVYDHTTNKPKKGKKAGFKKAVTPSGPPRQGGGPAGSPPSGSSHA